MEMDLYDLEAPQKKNTDQTTISKKRILHDIG
jgi:hypothetical protein